MRDDDFFTELSSGEEVPVRRVGDTYIIGYDHIAPQEFLHYASLLLADEGADNDYDEEDIEWKHCLFIDFGETDGISRLRFAVQNEDTFPVTVLECW